jgi:hypothetical protein
MGAWTIWRDGQRLNVDLEADGPLSDVDVDAVARALEPELTEDVRQVVLDGPLTREASGSRELLRVIRRLGAFVTRSGKAFTVRSL